MRLAISLLVLLAAIPLDAALDIDLLQGLGDAHYHRLDSKVVGRSYHILVRLPEDYDTGTQKYPTVYLLDGGQTFPLLSAYYRYLSLGKEVPASILVGIAYGTDYWQKGFMRSTDYTAPSPERDYWGGAADFQRMLGTELLPFIETTYRSDPERRIVFGQSLGGQFVLFTAQTQPNLFWGHIASNPALHRNLPFFLETRPTPSSDSRSKLFVSSGSDDDPRFREPAVTWMEAWSQQESLPWRLKTMTLDGQSHFSAAPAAFRKGLTWIFDDPSSP